MIKIQVRKTDNVVIVDCVGEVDLSSSPQLRATLLKAIESGPGSVLINMTGVTYIDSSGIATLVEGLQLSRETKTRLGLFGLQNNARSVLELARLHKVFNIFENEQDAINKIAETRPFGGFS